jgi:hypothetical protein
MAPPIFNEFVPLIVTDEFVALAIKVIEAHTAGILTVTAIPSLMVTASEEMGTDCPPQVAVLLQFPDTEAVLWANITEGDEMTDKRIKNIPILKVIGALRFKQYFVLLNKFICFILTLKCKIICIHFKITSLKLYVS